jgi:7-cyano-7-deazaguanine synthase
MDSKVDIVQRALHLGLPIQLISSCYQRKDECDSCRIRDHALIEEGRPDLATLMGQKFYEQGVLSTPVP